MHSSSANARNEAPFYGLSLKLKRHYISFYVQRRDFQNNLVIERCRHAIFHSIRLFVCKYAWARDSSYAYSSHTEPNPMCWMLYRFSLFPVLFLEKKKRRQLSKQNTRDAITI